MGARSEAIAWRVNLVRVECGRVVGGRDCDVPQRSTQQCIGPQRPRDRRIRETYW